MKKNGTLDICIPTFERYEKLKTTIEIFIDVISKSNFKDSIRIIISNNGSLDYTQEYLNNISRSYNFIKILDQKENIGFLNNIRKLWETSVATSVWTISDDDYYGVDLINEVINEAISGSISSVLIINSFHFSELDDGSMKIHQTNMLDLNNNFGRIISLNNGFFELVSERNYSAFGLLGSVVFPLEIIKIFLLNYSDSKTSYPHQLLLFGHASHSPVTIINYDALGWRVDGSNWSTDKVDASYKAHYVDYVEIIGISTWLPKKIARNIYKSVYKNSYKAILLFVLNNKKNNGWVLQNIFNNHFKYWVINIKFDFILLLASIVKMKLFSAFIEGKIKKSLNNNSNTA
jgi:hypothetical protein